MAINRVPSPPSGVPKGTTENRTASPEIGDVYSNTVTGYIEVYTAAGWSQLGVIPLSATIGTATDVGASRAYNNGAVSVTFTPNSGGGLASSYTATSTAGGYSATGSSSPIVVPNIPTGTSATFTVTATNGYGNALASSASNSATTTTVPQTPTIGTPTNIPGALFGSTVSASVPVTANATGGKAISAFTVTSNPGSLTGTGNSPVTVAGLSSGTSYTFSAVATNANGNSTATSASSSLTPSTVSQAPTIGTATISLATATVPFTAPANNGGSPITQYDVISSPGGFTGTGSASPITVAGLTPGTTYTFTVRATNASGLSAASSSSNSVTAQAQYSQTFTANGTWTRPAGVSTAEIILVGGGSGGARFAGSGTGGNGGGVYWQTGVPVSGNLSITVGGGGAFQTEGTSTSVSGGTSATATGGASPFIGNRSGLGGGLGNTVTYASGADNDGNSDPGGAGAGGNGGNSTTAPSAGNGGPGFYVSSVGSTFGGGGGGGRNFNAGGGLGGSGGGGAGSNTNGADASANTGGGGGQSGAGSNGSMRLSYQGGAGGSGIVIVRWIA